MKVPQFRWLAGIAGGVMVAVALSAAIAEARDNNSFDEIRQATAKFHRTEAAQDEGWDLRDGLDGCFDLPGTGGMGFHYINLEELGKLSEDPRRPEALVYAPGPNGQRRLAAVEYIVPAAAWDAAGNTTTPALLGQSFHLNAELGVYVLHAWVFENNPNGAFEDFNPNVPLCPVS